MLRATALAILIAATAMVAPLLNAQERQLPLEDVIKAKAGHLRLSSMWISGGAFDLRFRSGTGAAASAPIRAYSGSAGAALSWTFLGTRTNAWGNYSGDYSIASIGLLHSLSQSGEAGFMRRITPRFTFGVLGRAQSLNLGSRLFQQPSAAAQLQSPNFGSSQSAGGLGSTVDPISEANAGVTSTDVFALALGVNQRVYTVGVVSGFNVSPRTDIRLGASLSQSEFPPAAGTNVQLPYNRLRGGFTQGSIRHLATPRTNITWSWQGGQSRAQSQRFNFFSTTLGISRTLSPAWYVYIAGGGGASTVFRNGAAVPWLVQYTGQAGIGYASPRQGALLTATHDAGDRMALGFLSTSQANLFWNLRPPSSGWAISARAGGALLRSEGTRDQRAGSVQLGISRRIAGDVYLLAEGTYVTNVQFAPQRLFPNGTASGLLDTSAQRAVRLSIVYRPSPDRK